MSPGFREKALERLKSLDLPEVVESVFLGDVPYENLDIYFRSPYEIWNLDEIAYERALGKDVTPLWSDNSGYTVVAFRHDVQRRGFFRFNLENLKSIGPQMLNWQQILVIDFKEMIETDVAMEEIEDIARLYRFDHLEDLTHSLLGSRNQTPAEDRVWYESFLKRLNG